MSNKKKHKNEMENELLEDFITEAKEQLQTIEEDILGLEENFQNIDLLNKVLRSVHTVKGDSGFFGLKNIVSLSHVMEELLMKCRDGEIDLNRKITAQLLKGGDCLVKMLKRKDLGESMKIGGILKSLESFFDKEKKEDVFNESNNINNVSDNLLKKELPVYKIKFYPENFYNSIDEDSIKNGLTGYLKNFGTLIYSSVSDIELNERRTGFFELHYQSPMSKNILEFSLRQNSEDVVLMDPIKNIENDEIPEKEDDNFEIEDYGVSVNEGNEEDAYSEIKSVRVNVKLLDKLMNLAGEIVLGRNQLLRQFKNEANDSVLMSLSSRISELQENVMKTRLQPVGSVFSKFKRIVRDICEKLKKKINLEISGGGVEVDRSIVEALHNPLTHLLRNSIDHGIEYPEERMAVGKKTYGSISLRAYHESGQVIIEIQDDGRGLNIALIKKKIVDKGLLSFEEVERMSTEKIANYIFMPGFSTTTTISELSGRGVGMDVVKSTFEKFGGNLEIQTLTGKGTSVRIKLPLTLAIVSCLIFSSGGELFAIPQIEIQEVVQIKGTNINQEIEFIEEAGVFRLRDRIIPVIDYEKLLEKMDVKSEINHKDNNLKVKEIRNIQNLMILKSNNNEFGLLVDEIIDTEEVVVKQLPSLIRNCQIYSGTTITGNGSVIMIIDIEGIIKEASLDFKNLKEKLLDFEIENFGEKIKTDFDRYLSFYNDSSEVFSVSLRYIQRIEKISKSQILHLGNREYVTLRGKEQFFFRLDQYLPVSGINDNKDNFYLIIPNEDLFPVGILISEIMDTIEIKYADIDESEFNVPGIAGTYMYMGKLNLIVDLPELINVVSTDFGITKEGQKI